VWLPLYKLKLHLAVDWIYQEYQIEQQSPDQLPPSKTIQDLIGYVRIGDVLRLNQYLFELIQQQPEYTSFAQRIMTLAGEFRLLEIKKLLQIASEELAGNVE
jgi:hypothetical protein